MLLAGTTGSNAAKLRIKSITGKKFDNKLTQIN